MQKNIFVFGVFLFLLNACDSAGSGVAVDIPNAQISCDSAKCTGATGAKDAYVTLSLSGCAPDQIDLNTVATGYVSVICAGTGCTGTVSSWTDASSNPIASVESRTYDLCGWIDIDGNATKDSSVDAFSESSESLTGSTLTLSDWSVTYSSVRKIHHNR